MNNEIVSLMNEIEETGDGLETERISVRSSLDTLQQILVFWTTLGAFNILTKVIEAWVTRHRSMSLKISYITEDNANVEIQYTHQKISEIKKLSEEYPPKLGNPVSISIKSDEKTLE